jgi:hypothetical protein
MAGRGYALIFTSVWSDDDFRTLSPAAQRHYFVLVSQPDINYAGVLPLTERRWARCCSSTSLADVQAATAELSSRRYVVVDHETEELLVRSFVRRDGLWKQPKMLGVAVREALGTASARLRVTLAEEFERVRELIPHRDPVDNRIEMLDNAVKNLMEGPALTPPEGLGMGTHNPSGGVRPRARPAPAPSTYTNTNTNPPVETLEGGVSESNAREKTGPPNKSPATNRPHERCAKHRADDTEPGPCRGCKQTRERAEQWDRDTAQKRRMAIRECEWCDAEGWRIDPRHKYRGPITPAVRCDHSPT